ncbi:hypothetical protein ACFQJC_02550 [Haloferax namakaokahaiae]|uniref:Uncharacterized protein n=1 Tax=Haloferax namakaokahaiae TaxID=1748331 RepID=A0ABD5ZB40_9EURY
MGLLSSRQVLLGLVLILIGTVGLLPGALPNVAQTSLLTYALVPAAAALVAGTYLVGTSEGGRAV